MSTDPAEHPGSGQRTDSAGAGQASTVLVVEDDPAIGNMLVVLLNAEGYRAELVEDGGRALDTVRTCRPDLITLDLSLPNVDGVEILDQLDRNGEARVPIVVVSAYTERLAERHRQRVSAIIPKPFEIDDLLRSISTVLRDA